MQPNTIQCGDALKVLATWPDNCVDCVVTSPPYWGLRDYGVAGQIGLESSAGEYVSRMVNVFEQVWRVLKPSGTLWLNMGDCYAAAIGSGKQGKNGQRADRRHSQKTLINRATNLQRTNTTSDFATPMAHRIPQQGLKSKDLCGMPWRLAFALQAWGWYLRADIIWHKPNPMPESVTDRPTKAHEYVFLLTKSSNYFYDAAAISEPAISRRFGDAGGARHGDEGRLYVPRKSVKRGEFNGKTNAMPGREAFRAITQTRNKRSVWRVSLQPYRGAHFATFPEKLVEPCILAGCPADGIVCDPFMGAGTTALVAAKLGRRWAGIELNPKYIQLAMDRLGLLALA